MSERLSDAQLDEIERWPRIPASCRWMLRELVAELRASRERTENLRAVIGHALDEMSGGKHWDAEDVLTGALGGNDGDT